MRYSIIIIMWVAYLVCITANNIAVGWTSAATMSYGVALSWWFITLLIIFVIILEHFTIWYEALMK